ncbi:hypothetical protein DID75_01065 [Candidatus Marinamargulisbacteria bacterium SCGC AG-410-N11]|nr:hypothetical protein DID75_01065 [Candidatus Marinamargulisbacteria bacterium SCGC AG-410-N11]
MKKFTAIPNEKVIGLSETKTKLIKPVTENLSSLSIPIGTGENTIAGILSPEVNQESKQSKVKSNRKPKEFNKKVAYLGNPKDTVGLRLFEILTSRQDWITDQETFNFNNKTLYFQNKIFNKQVNITCGIGFTFKKETEETKQRKKDARNQIIAEYLQDIKDGWSNLLDDKKNIRPDNFMTLWEITSELETELLSMESSEETKSSGYSNSLKDKLLGALQDIDAESFLILMDNPSFIDIINTFRTEFFDLKIVDAIFKVDESKRKQILRNSINLTTYLNDISGRKQLASKNFAEKYKEWSIQQITTIIDNTKDVKTVYTGLIKLKESIKNYKASIKPIIDQYIQSLSYQQLNKLLVLAQNKDVLKETIYSKAISSILISDNDQEITERVTFFSSLQSPKVIDKIAKKLLDSSNKNIEDIETLKDQITQTKKESNLIINKKSDLYLKELELNQSIDSLKLSIFNLKRKLKNIASTEQDTVKTEIQNVNDSLIKLNSELSSVKEQQQTNNKILTETDDKLKQLNQDLESTKRRTNLFDRNRTTILNNLSVKTDIKSVKEFTKEILDIVDILVKNIKFNAVANSGQQNYMKMQESFDETIKGYERQIQESTEELENKSKRLQELETKIEEAFKRKEKVQTDKREMQAYLNGSAEGSISSITSKIQELNEQKVKMENLKEKHMISEGSHYNRKNKNEFSIVTNNKPLTKYTLHNAILDGQSRIEVSDYLNLFNVIVELYKYKQDKDKQFDKTMFRLILKRKFSSEAVEQIILGKLKNSELINLQDIIKLQLAKHKGKLQEHKIEWFRNNRNNRNLFEILTSFSKLSDLNLNSLLEKIADSILQNHSLNSVKSDLKDTIVDLLKEHKKFQEIFSVITIQSARRKFIALQKRRLKQQQISSAIKIQTAIRGFKAINRVRQIRTVNRSALAIQQLYRNSNARQILTRLKEERRIGGSATKIQNMVRGRNARQKLRQLRSALKVQQLYRRLKASQELMRLRDDKQTKSAIQIQSIARMYAEKQIFRAKQESTRLREESLRESATKIQSIARMYAEKQIYRAKQESTRLREEQKNAEVNQAIRGFTANSREALSNMNASAGEKLSVSGQTIAEVERLSQERLISDEANVHLTSALNNVSSASKANTTDDSSLLRSEEILVDMIGQKQSSKAISLKRRATMATVGDTRKEKESNEQVIAKAKAALAQENEVEGNGSAKTSRLLMLLSDNDNENGSDSDTSDSDEDAFGMPLL